MFVKWRGLLQRNDILTEAGTHKPLVGGSNPSAATKKPKGRSQVACLFLHMGSLEMNNSNSKVTNSVKSAKFRTSHFFLLQ